MNPFGAQAILETKGGNDDGSVFQQSAGQCQVCQLVLT